MLLSALIRLLANAVGLIVAAIVVNGFSITGISFVVAVGIFTVIQIVVSPLLREQALRSMPALMGGVALVSTFIGLLATSLLSSGFKIHGIGAWLFATVIVWVASLIAMLILPLIILKDVVDDADRRRRGRR